MLVSELIKKLESLPQDASVQVISQMIDNEGTHFHWRAIEDLELFNHTTKGNLVYLFGVGDQFIG